MICISLAESTATGDIECFALSRSGNCLENIIDYFGGCGVTALSAYLFLVIT